MYPTSEGRDPAALRPGRDLVLDAPIEHGVALPRGVLVDDFLGSRTREETDVAAQRAAGTWIDAHRADLTLDGVDLARVWEFELFCEVFLPHERALRGIGEAVQQTGAERISCHGVDPGLVHALEQTLEAPVDAAAVGVPSAYPSARAVPWRPPRRQRVVAAAFERLGVPGWPRGDILFIPYWHLLPVYERLRRDAACRPVADLARPAIIRRRQTAADLLRGGWVAHPGARARRRARTRLESALAAVGPSARAAGAPGANAIAMLSQRAGDTLAVVEAKRRSFRRRPPRLLVLPFDSMPDSRMAVAAAEPYGIASLVVQHGFHSEPNDPDKLLADHVATWTERDATWVRRNGRGHATVTGNPGVRSARSAPRKLVRADGSTLVLVQDYSRASARRDVRVSLEHLGTALRGVASARPGSTAIVRPHPADPNEDAYRRLAASVPAVHAEVNVSAPIDALIAAADLCVGSLSTATLQAGIAGVPVVMLASQGAAAPWPLDGSAVPTAADEQELADAIADVLSRDSVPGATEMQAALGMRAGAADEVTALIRSLAAC